MGSKLNIGLVISNCNQNSGASSYESEIMHSMSHQSDTWSLKVIHAGCCQRAKFESHNRDINYRKANRKVTQLKSLLRTSLIFNLLFFKIGLKHTHFEKFLKRNHIDLIYFVSPNHLSLQVLSVPMINTVWDLGHLDKFKFHETNLNGNYEVRELYYGCIIRKSMYIFVDSEKTKQNIIDNYGYAGNRIITLGFPIKKFDNNIEFKFHDLPKEFFFYSASFWTHKAHLLLIEACHKLKQDGAECNFVFAGVDRGNLKKIQKYIDLKNLDENIKVYQNLSDNEIGYLINKSKCVVFPSLIGPTNLPPLEALSLGKRIIVSSVHSELFNSEMIVKIEKDDIDSWVNSLKNFDIDYKNDPLTSNKVAKNILRNSIQMKLDLKVNLDKIIEEIKVIQIL
jgi:glycosyltransferase involved in cell wall biosynthesis